MNTDTELLQEEALGAKLIKKGSRGYFFMILIAPVGYIIKVLVSNALSVEEIGIFYSVLGLIVLLSSYNDLGLTEALMYFLPKYWIEKKYNEFKTIWYITLGTQLISGILIALGLYFGAERLAINHFKTPEAANLIRILCRYFIGINFLQTFWACYTAFQDIFASQLQETVKLYTTLIFTIIFRVSHTLNVGNFALARIAGIALGVLMGTIFFIKKYRHTLQKGIFNPSASLLKREIRYAFWVFLGANVGSLFSQIDQQLIINLLGPKAAGYYNNFFSLLGIYNIILSPILGILFPIATELITKNSIEKIKLLQNTLYKYLSILAISIGGLFLGGGPVIASILFGTKFLPSGELLRRIGPALIFNVLISINYGILAGRGMVKERVKIIGRALLVNIILNVITIVWLKRELYGAIIALTGGWILLRRLSYKKIHQQQAITFSRKYLGRNTLVIGSMTSIIRRTSPYIFNLDDGSRYHNLARFAAIGIGYYIILAGANYKSIQRLIGEVKNIRK